MFGYKSFWIYIYVVYLKRGLYNVGVGIMESSNVNCFSICYYSLGKCIR